MKFKVDSDEEPSDYDTKNANTEDQSSDSFVSGENPSDNEQFADAEREQIAEREVVDELFRLKKSLIHEELPAKNAETFLKSIVELLEERPARALVLYQWNILDEEIIYLLRSRFFKTALALATTIIESVKKVPESYVTKRFAFYITEKLYKSMEDSPRIILNFAKAVFKTDRSAVAVFYDVGFFVLANGVISYETCELYNTVFDSLFFPPANISLENRNKERLIDSNTLLPAEGSIEPMFEINRKRFDPEVLFRTKAILELKNPKKTYKAGVYDKIYNDCTNIRLLADLSCKDLFNMLLYKRMTFMNEDLDLLILENNPTAIDFYRKTLENGGPSDSRYVNVLVEGLEKKESHISAAVCLYYLMDGITNFGKFKQETIARIFQVLENSCEAECAKNMQSKNENSLCKEVEDSTMDILRGISMGCDDEINSCTRERVIALLAHLYKNVFHEYFFKPSFLILLRANHSHCESQMAFIKQHYVDFYGYLKASTSNVARVLFPVARQAKAKKEAVPAEHENEMHEIEMHGIDEPLDSCELENNELMARIRKMTKNTRETKHEENAPKGQVRLKRNVIESDSE
ncbi:hypothetical protein ENBRE01_2045 [Enteropsectra breve]|nr:hypothetical protein ENBRE01_2045 [Enteropsectra breve]